MEKRCLICQKSFHCPKWFLGTKREQIFCSKQCRGVHSRGRKKAKKNSPVNCTCIQCGKSFIRWYSLIKQGGGKFCSNKCAQSDESKLGKNPTLNALHMWIHRKKSRPKKCSNCGIKGKENKRGWWTIQWANIDGKYRRNLDDFIPLCVKCHVHYDIKLRGGWIKNQYGKQNIRKTTKLLSVNPA